MPASTTAPLVSVLPPTTSTMPRSPLSFASVGSGSGRPSSSSGVSSTRSARTDGDIWLGSHGLARLRDRLDVVEATENHSVLVVVLRDTAVGELLRSIDGK